MVPALKHALFSSLIMAAVLAAAPTTAQTQQQLKWCNGQDGATPDIIISACTAVIQAGKFPGNIMAMAYSNRGNAYNTKGLYERALQDLNQAIRLNPNLVSAFNNRGVAYDGKNQLDLAIADFDRAIQLDPNAAQPFNNRGRDYTLKGEYDRALQDFDQAIRLDPKYAAAFFNRASAYLLRGNYDRAIADFDQTIQLEPRNANAFHFRGLAKQKKGDTAGGDADIAKASTLGYKEATAAVVTTAAPPQSQQTIPCNYDPEGKVPLDEMIASCTAQIQSDRQNTRNLTADYLNRAIAFIRKGDYDHAIMDCTEASRLNPKSESAFRFRAVAYTYKGDYDNAIADFSRAIQINAKNEIAFYLRGDVYSKKGDYERAIADFNEAIRLNPKYADAYYSRGTAFLRKGDYDNAIADFNELINLDPTSTNAYDNRGYANFFKGKFNAASVDFIGASQHGPPKPYSLLWGFIVWERAGQNGAILWSPIATKLKTKDWPYPVIEFYLGQRTMDSMRAAATNPDDQCDVAFYVGEWQIVHGNRDEAQNELQKAADICAKNTLEYMGAITDLKRAF